MAVETFDDKAMILAPDEWPMYPFLPLKRREDGQNVEWGYLVDQGYEDGVDGPREVMVRGAKIDDPIKRRDYFTTVDELLAAGWIVD